MIFFSTVNIWGKDNKHMSGYEQFWIFFTVPEFLQPSEVKADCRLFTKRFFDG